jgi:uncharacterized RDD family membrane protein YckC
VKCPRCHRESKDGTLFCPGCGAPLALRPDPAPRSLDVSLSLDRRSPDRTPATEAPLELARTEADLTEQLPPWFAGGDEAPAPAVTRPPEPAAVRPPPVAALRAAAPAPASSPRLAVAAASADPSSSQWELGAALGGAEPTFAPGALARTAEPTFAAGALARTAEPTFAPGPLGPVSDARTGPIAGGPAASGDVLPDAEVDALEIHLRRAPTWRRVAAWAIDLTPFLALLAFALEWLHAGSGAGASSLWAAIAAGASDPAVGPPVAAGVGILYLVYQTLCHALAGATLGKWVARLRVYGPDGRPPSFGRSAARAWLSVASTALLGLGLLLALFTASGRSLHDFLVRTWVVEAP